MCNIEENKVLDVRYIVFKLVVLLLFRWNVFDIGKLVVIYISSFIMCICFFFNIVGFYLIT